MVQGTHGAKSEWRKRKERQERLATYDANANAGTGLPHGYHSGMTVLLVGVRPGRHCPHCHMCVCLSN